MSPPLRNLANRGKFTTQRFILYYNLSVVAARKKECESCVDHVSWAKRNNISQEKERADTDLEFSFCLVWFGLVSLFNGISNFVGYLMPKQENGGGTI